MKIGIYGGTFNPPHLGHLTAAAAVIATLKLDKLLLIPASIPPHKDLPAGSATAEQRLEMTRMAGEQLGLGSKVETLDMEVRREGKSFTSDTLAELKAQFPEDELWLLMGTDMFLSFETWHEPEKIASLAGIAAFGRTKADMEPQFSAQRDKLYRLYPDARIFTLTVPGVIDISSTELRAQLSCFGTHLAKQNADPLDEKAFRTVLDNGAYPGTLKRDDAIAELMKLYMRQQLGTLPAAVARN